MATFASTVGTRPALASSGTRITQYASATVTRNSAPGTRIRPSPFAFSRATTNPAATASSANAIIGAVISTITSASGPAQLRDCAASFQNHHELIGISAPAASSVPQLRYGTAIGSPGRCASASSSRTAPTPPTQNTDSG